MPYRELTPMEVAKIVSDSESYAFWVDAITTIRNFWGERAYYFQLEIEGDTDDEGGMNFRVDVPALVVYDRSNEEIYPHPRYWTNEGVEAYNNAMTREEICRDLDLDPEEQDAHIYMNQYSTPIVSFLYDVFYDVAVPDQLKYYGGTKQDMNIDGLTNKPPKLYVFED